MRVNKLNQKENKDINITKKNINGGFWYGFLAVLTLLVAITGATYAYLLATGNKNNDVIVEAGTLSIKYIDGINVNNPKLYPRSEPNDISDFANAYVKRFQVKSTGTLDQYISIYFDVTKNEFSSNIIKYAIYNVDEKLNVGYINGVGQVKLINNAFLKSGDTASYVLLVWLDDNNKNQDIEKDKNISGTIIVDAIQYNE